MSRLYVAVESITAVLFVLSVPALWWLGRRKGELGWEMYVLGFALMAVVFGAGLYISWLLIAGDVALLVGVGRGVVRLRGRRERPGGASSP